MSTLDLALCRLPIKSISHQIRISWAPLLRLEREARAAADAARAASGGGVDMGLGEESAESEQEHDVWRTYYEIYDNYFDYDL